MAMFVSFLHILCELCSEVFKYGSLNQPISYLALIPCLGKLPFSSLNYHIQFTLELFYQPITVLNFIKTGNVALDVQFSEFHPFCCKKMSSGNIPKNQVEFGIKLLQL